MVRAFQSNGPSKSFPEQYGLFDPVTGAELEWQPYDGSPLPRKPMVSSHKLTDDYRQDAYARRPGVTRRRPKPSLGSSLRWYPAQSTNRLLESQLFFPDPSLHQRASELKDIQHHHQRLKVQVYQKHDDMPPSTAERKSQPNTGNALRWRLCPWTAPMASPSDRPMGIVQSLSAVQKPAAQTRSDTAGGNDPRAGFGFDCIEAVNIVPLTTTANNRLPPLPPSPTSPSSPSLSRTASPTIARTKSDMRRTVALPSTVLESSIDSPKSRRNKNSDELYVKKPVDLMSQYDLYHAQAVADGTKVPQTEFKVDKDGKQQVSGYDVFALDYRDKWNLEHPELADRQVTVRKDWDLPVSEELLQSRRKRIAEAALEQWTAVDPEIRTDFNARAEVLNQPPAPTVEQLLGSSNFSWAELNRAHEWFTSTQCRDQFKAQRLQISNLESELNDVKAAARNAECTVVDPEAPTDMDVDERPERPDTATDDRPDPNLEMNLMDDIKSLNMDLNQKKKARKNSMQGGVSAVYMGSESEPAALKAKKMRRGRRTSLNISDLQWRSMGSLAQAGVKIARGRKKSVTSGIERGDGDTFVRSNLQSKSPEVSPLKSPETRSPTGSDGS